MSWLWPGRLPLGKLVTVDGDPGVGKSTVALTFAAIVTTAGRWPDKTRCEYSGDVILLSAEDGLADTIRPRLDAAGADVAKVHAVQGVPLSEGEALRMATLADVALLRRLIKRTHARLVIIDVLMAYLPTGTDSYRDQDVRQVLARLAALAESTGCAILLLRHLKKGKDDPLYRGGGSVGIVGAARVGLLVALDPDDDTLRVLASVKNNLAPMPPSLTYRLVPDELRDVARVEWVGESEHDAHALLAEHTHDTKIQSAGGEAQQWLQDYLTTGASAPAKQRTTAAKRGTANQASRGRPANLKWLLKLRASLGSLIGRCGPRCGRNDPTRLQSRQPPQQIMLKQLVTEATAAHVTAPTGPGRCPDCGWHIATQGHHDDCSANNDEVIW